MWMGECLFHNKFQQQLTISQLRSTQTYSSYSQGLYNVLILVSFRVRILITQKLQFLSLK
jgi:hypothetical protein